MAMNTCRVDTNRCTGYGRLHSKPAQLPWIDTTASAIWFHSSLKAEPPSVLQMPRRFPLVLIGALQD